MYCRYLIRKTNPEAEWNELNTVYTVITVSHCARTIPTEIGINFYFNNSIALQKIEIKKDEHFARLS